MGYRSVKSELWTEPWFQTLSKDAKLLFLLLVTHGNVVGLFQLSDPYICLLSGLDLAGLSEAKKDLEAHGKIRTYSDGWIWVVNFAPQ